MIAGISNCLTRLPNSRGCKTTLWSRDCPSQQRGDRRGRVSFTRAEYLNDDRRTSLIMTPKRSPHVMPFLPGARELLPLFSVLSLVLVRKTPKVALRESSLTQEYLQTHYQKESWTHVYTDGSAENAGGMEGQESAPSTQEVKKTKLALLPAYAPQTIISIKLKQKPWKQQQPKIEVSTHASSNVILLTDALSILQGLQSNRDTEHKSAALASLCRGHASTLQWIPSHCSVLGNEAADWQRKAQERSRWIGQPAALRWRPSSRPSNTASGGTNTHGTTRLTPTTRGE